MILPSRDVHMWQMTYGLIKIVLDPGNYISRPNDSLAPARSALAGLCLRPDSFRRFPSGSSPPLRGGEGEDTGTVRDSGLGRQQDTRKVVNREWKARECLGVP